MATPVRHVVMFKYKDGVNKDEVHASITAGLASLPAQIPEIANSQFGPDLGLDPERNHDYVGVFDFKSSDDYLVYAKHPAHIKVIVDSIKPYLAPGGRVAVQYSL